MMIGRRVLLLLLVAGATTASAQAPAASARALIEKARADMQNLAEDAAYDDLNRALRLASITRAERVRALTLLGILEVGFKKNRTAGRDMFLAALRLDSLMKFDSLAVLDGEAPGVFAEARAIVPMPSGPARTETVTEAAGALLMSMLLPRDTLLSVADPRYFVGAQPNRRARIVATVVAAESPNVLVWADSLAPGEARRLAWPLLRPDGSYIPDGRYVLKLTATDSIGNSRVLDQPLRVARAVPDTQVHPAPLERSAFAPETISVGTRTSRVLLTGTAFAAAVALTPMVLGNPDLNDNVSADPTSYAVAGGVAVLSIMRFLKGGRPAVLSAENIQKNRDLRDEWDRRSKATVAANVKAIAAAGIGVAMEVP